LNVEPHGERTAFAGTTWPDCPDAGWRCALWEALARVGPAC